MPELTFQQKAWRLSPMYACYFTLFGVVFPYLARFLDARGLTAPQIGVISALVFGVNVFAPFLFSLITDRTGRRLPMIRFGFVMMGLFYLLTLFGTGFYWYLGVFGLFGIFLSAVLPQMEGLAMTVLGPDKARYGQVRLWGSVGYVIIVWLLGIALDYLPVTILPVIGVVLCGLMWLTTLLIPAETRLNSAQRNAIRAGETQYIDWRQVSVLLAVVFFWQIGIAPYNTFFDLFLKARDFSASTIGFLISFGTATEIAIFLVIGSWFQRFTERFLLLTALIATVLRWSLLAMVDNSFALVFFTQMLHALTFGVIHSVAIHRVGRLFPPSRQGLGQGLYVATGMGVGLIVGNLLSGWLWTGAGAVYWTGAASTAIATLIAFFAFGAIRGQDSATESARQDA
ncbi:MFS transporter [Saccharospirillum sp. HFRX-1]|uniref:MFS transporter n=1 Tax=unclassified Saccharospirillum TaxID=2633430 RepID=UPI0037244411